MAARAAVNTTLAGATGAITALLATLYFSHHRDELAFDLTKTLNGALAGLVAITAGCATLDPWAAFVVGILAGLIYLGASNLVLKLRLDDCVDGIPIHFFCGMWGLVATGLLSSPDGMKEAYGSASHVGLLYSFGHVGSMDASLLWNQLLAIVFIVTVNVVFMFPFFGALKYMDWLRVNTNEEIVGLDACYQHATQEDHEELTKSIVQEIRHHKAATKNPLEQARDVIDGL